MKIKRKDLTNVFFPFSELLTGDYFILHEDFKHNLEPCVYKKTGSDTYVSVNSNEIFKIAGEYAVHKTNVSVAPSCYMFNHE